MNTYQFQKLIKSFYLKNRRDFDWRNTQDPYQILVSEMMLQQTQTSRVKLKYQQFLTAFPTPQSLIKASLVDVLAVWSGLGYNRRAKYLQETCKILWGKYEGDFPQDPKVLQKLPGLGKATSASVLVFSKNIPLVFIETNIRRVFIHFFFDDKTDISDREIEVFVEQTLDKRNPREWYYALMDYGVYLAQTTENANRKSKHYTVQSKFEGSIRKVRGLIVKKLSLTKQLTLSNLIAELSEEPEKVEKALEGLQKDKLITIQNNVVAIL